MTMILILLMERKRLFLKLLRIKHNSRNKKSNSLKMMDGSSSRKNDFYLYKVWQILIFNFSKVNKRQNKKIIKLRATHQQSINYTFQ